MNSKSVSFGIYVLREKYSVSKMEFGQLTSDVIVENLEKYYKKKFFFSLSIVLVHLLIICKKIKYRIIRWSHTFKFN